MFQEDEIMEFIESNQSIHGNVLIMNKQTNRYNYDVNCFPYIYIYIYSLLLNIYAWIYIVNDLYFHSLLLFHLPSRTIDDKYIHHIYFVSKENVSIERN